MSTEDYLRAIDAENTEKMDQADMSDEQIQMDQISRGIKEKDRQIRKEEVLARDKWKHPWRVLDTDYDNYMLSYYCYET